MKRLTGRFVLIMHAGLRPVLSQTTTSSRQCLNAHIGAEACVGGIVGGKLGPSILPQDRSDWRVAITPERRRWLARHTYARGRTLPRCCYVGSWHNVRAQPGAYEGTKAAVLPTLGIKGRFKVYGAGLEPMSALVNSTFDRAGAANGGSAF